MSPWRNWCFRRNIWNWIETNAMAAIWFGEKTPDLSADPHRMDVVFFVGLAPVRPRDILPEPLDRWFRERGWHERVESTPGVISLRDVPVPVDSWETYGRYFAWPWDADGGPPEIYPLGRAVQSFFAQGGRKAYVVSMGDPIGETADTRQRVQALERVLYGVEGLLGSVTTRDELAVLNFPPLDFPEADPDTWHAIHHGTALGDVALVAYPDLPYLVASLPDPVPVAMPSRKDPESFVECFGEELPASPCRVVISRAPRCDGIGLRVWKQAVQTILLWMQQNAREWVLVAALPLPMPELDSSWWAVALQDVFGVRPEEGGCASAFFQCVFPWLVDPSEAGALLSPDGPLLGLLAANALTRGTFRSAAGRYPVGVSGIVPVLSLAERQKAPDQAHTMERRLCLFHSTPNGVVLASDRTTSLEPSHGPGPVSRLLGFIFKAARRLGETMVFENSSPRTWNQLRRVLANLLESIYLAGGLEGARRQDAFHVMCGLHTMTGQDADSGRLVAHIQVRPAIPVETLQVVLAIEPNGTVRMD